MTDREKLIELIAAVRHCPQNDEDFGGCAKCKWLPDEDCTAARIAEHLLANGVMLSKDTDVHSKWISVDDEMPHAEYGESDNVLAVDGFRIVKMLYFDGGCWCRPTGETVVYENPRCRITHWMPLPQPPREE